MNEIKVFMDKMINTKKVEVGDIVLIQGTPYIMCCIDSNHRIMLISFYGNRWSDRNYKDTNIGDVLQKIKSDIDDDFDGFENEEDVVKYLGSCGITIVPLNK